MNTFDAAVELIVTTKIVAIIRSKDGSSLLKAAQALADGGVRAIEVTLTSPNALTTIRDARKTFGESVLFGAGSVTTLAEAEAAIEAGAQFLVSPIVSVPVIQYATRSSICSLPGCFTPTEMFSAVEAGAPLVKLFPADVGGTAYLKAVRAPLPNLRIVAVGGVNADNLTSFLEAGAVAVGIGSDLVNDKLLESKNFEEITKRAARLTSLVTKR